MALLSAEKSLHRRTPLGKLGFLMKDSIFYGATSAVGRSVHLITMPLFTRVFDKPEYAVVDGLGVLGAVFLGLVIVGQDSAVARYYYQSDDPEERRQIVAQALLIELVAAVSLGALLLLSAPWILTAYFGAAGAEAVPAFRILALALPFAALAQFWQNLLKWTFARGPFLVVTAGTTASVIGLVLYFLVERGMGIEGVFLALLITHATFAVLGAFFCRKSLAWPRSLAHAGKLLRFGGPYMVIGLTIALVPSLDRYFVIDGLGLEVAAAYAVSYRLSMVIKLPLAGFQTAWGPFAYAIHRQQDAAATYDKVLWLYARAATIIAVGIIVLAEPLTRLLASSRYEGQTLAILPLGLAVLIESMAAITGIGIDLSERTSRSARCYLLALATTLVAVQALIPVLGALGAAVGVLIGKTVLTGSMTWCAYRLHPLRYRLPGAAGVVLGGAAIAGGHALACHLVPGSARAITGTVIAGLACWAWSIIRRLRAEGALVARAAAIDAAAEETEGGPR